MPLHRKLRAESELRVRKSTTLRRGILQNFFMQSVALIIVLLSVVLIVSYFYIMGMKSEIDF